MSKGLNLQTVKSKNRSMVLYLLNEHKMLSRKDIARGLSLTPAAVTKICAELIAEGYIKEVGEQGGGAGRREIMLSLRLSDKYVLGINAEKNCVTYSLSSLDGKLIKSKAEEFCDDASEVINTSREFLNECAEYKENIIGAGVCIIGSVVDDGYAVWKSGNLKTEFRSALGLPVVVENNVKAFAESELIYGDVKDSASMLFFKWGPGVGSSIVTDGRVFSGNDSGATEIGHYIVKAGGEQCRCGRRGCLETEASADALYQAVKSKGINISREKIADCDIDEVNEVITERINYVAPALMNTATILGTNTVVLFGAMFENPKTAEKLKESCARFSGYVAPALRISKLNDKRAYIGATAICAKNLFFEK
ncbi:MAG: ROK family transcriptional regulator [Clostridia bacterium]|nr:ROK family transcriptional regulator [Clostridia bacterium]